ncbi:MAG: hypothetical protein WCK78_16725 [Paludibacter sp.]
MKNKFVVNRLLFVLLFIIILLNCCSKSKNTILKMNNLSQNYDSIANEVIENGDTACYQELWYENIDSPNKKFLYYAIIMANKYKYPQAYYDVYDCLIKAYPDPLKLDSTTRKMAIEYLIKGAERKHPQSLISLGELYIKGIIIKKDTVLGRKLKREGWK